MRRNKTKSDDYDELNELVRDNYKNETGQPFEGQVLPGKTDIAFTLSRQNESKVLIHLKSRSVVEDVSEDAGAFESMAFVIRRWSGFSQISLRWDNPYDLERPSLEHYQGFLYRVKRFSECYPWFSVDDSSMRLLGKLLIVDGLEYFIENPISDAVMRISLPPLNQMKTKDLEHYIWAHQDKLNDLVGTKEISRGLPLRVYVDDGTLKVYLFPRRYSVIDLWGLNKGSSILSIFKLKEFTSKNCLSLISELFFNAMVMRDTLSGILIYPMYARKTYLGRGQYFTIRRAKAINSYILSDDLPGLIDDKLMKDLNDIESPEIPIEIGHISIDSKFNLKRKI